MKYSRRKFYKFGRQDDGTYAPDLERIEVPEAEAELVGSRVNDTQHYPAIDLDIPLWIRETSPGKFHLYIDFPVDDAAYWPLLDAMVDAGLVQHGFVAASKERGQTHLRLKPKGNNAHNEVPFTMDDSRDCERHLVSTDTEPF